MARFVFEHDQNPGGLYALFSHYFLTRWEDPAFPEYDLKTHELIHRDSSGKEVSQEETVLLFAPKGIRKIYGKQLDASQPIVLS